MEHCMIRFEYITRPLADQKFLIRSCMLTVISQPFPYIWERRAIPVLSNDSKRGFNFIIILYVQQTCVGNPKFVKIKEKIFPRVTCPEFSAYALPLHYSVTLIYTRCFALHSVAVFFGFLYCSCQLPSLLDSFHSLPRSPIHSTDSSHCLSQPPVCLVDLFDFLSRCPASFIDLFHSPFSRPLYQLGQNHSQLLINKRNGLFAFSKMHQNNYSYRYWIVRENWNPDTLFLVLRQRKLLC